MSKMPALCDEDESFFVVSGIFEITVGGKTTTGGPGTYAYGPRNVPHQYRCLCRGTPWWGEFSISIQAVVSPVSELVAFMVRLWNGYQYHCSEDGVT